MYYFYVYEKDTKAVFIYESHKRLTQCDKEYVLGNRHQGKQFVSLQTTSLPGVCFRVTTNNTLVRDEMNPEEVVCGIHLNMQEEKVVLYEHPELEDFLLPSLRYKRVRLPVLREDIHGQKDFFKKHGTCAYCHLTAEEAGVDKLRRCAGCSKLNNKWYCSPKCQLAAWPDHKLACKRRDKDKTHHT